jgi:CopA family copper-resistance protein
MPSLDAEGKIAGGPATMTRRRFITSTATVGFAGGTLARVLGGARPSPRSAGQFGELRATDPGGIDLYIERNELLIGGELGRAITINGSVPGPVIRFQEGKEAVIRVHNRMREPTSVHWHGILLPFTMDGVPGISFKGIAPGETFTYRYRAQQSGTYWYHSHSGLQEQLGHYGMLIFEPAEPEPVPYDVEYPVVLSDWTFEDPHTVLHKLKTIEGYYNFQRPTIANIDNQMEAMGMTLGKVIGKRLEWDRMRMDPTDIMDVTGATLTFLMNGKAHWENPTFEAQPGQRVRLRFLNSSATATYDVRIPGLPMTVIEADGTDVRPVETDEFRIAVAETYDVIVTVPEERAYTIFAETMDRSGFARGTLAPKAGMSAEVPERRKRPMLTMADMGMMMNHDGMKGVGNQSSSGSGAHGGQHDQMHRGSKESPPGEPHNGEELPTQDLPERLMHGPAKHGPGSITMAHSHYRRVSEPGIGLGKDGRRVLTYSQLRSHKAFSYRRPPTRQFDLHLTGNMHKFIWGFDGKKWSQSDMLRLVFGERVRINMRNDTMMSHPIHLHGMFMDLWVGGDYMHMPRKHTVNVQPAELLTVDITVDAPGQWAFHCHLLYHMEAGMFRTVAVVKSLEGGPIDAKG